MKTNILTLLAIVLVLFSCNELEEGVVVDKHYEPERQYVQIIPVTYPIGKNLQIIMIPYVVTDNEDYVLQVIGYSKGEEVVEYVYTSEECYNSLQIGDNWKKTEYCSLTDNNNSKVEQ